MQTILIAAPQSDFLEWTRRQLESAERRVLTTETADEALKLFRQEAPDLVIADSHTQPYPGQELLARIRKDNPNAIVIIISDFATNQAVIEAMKLGAFDFIRKEQLPFNLKIVVEEALRARADAEAATTFEPRMTVEEHQDKLVGRSESMQQVFKMIGRVAPSDVPVMITGESGSGKDLVARAIHQYSNRSGGSFLAMNCAAIPEPLLESELFGHEKGAFTGATAQRVGRFEQTDGGTLFLDEIGDLPLGLQGKLLRVLQDGEFSRLGGNTTLRADVRIIAATNKNLEREVAERAFREDLFYRLNVVHLHLPPLRQRREDIRLLAEYFLNRIAARKHAPELRLSEEALIALEEYSWPGNVRELENTLERASVLATTDLLLPGNIPLGAKADMSGPRQEGSSGSPLGSSSIENAIMLLLKAALSNPNMQLLPWLEREFTLHALKMTEGNQVQAAKLLGITRATLRKRVERYGMPDETPAK